MLWNHHNSVMVTIHQLRMSRHILAYEKTASRRHFLNVSYILILVDIIKSQPVCQSFKYLLCIKDLAARLITGNKIYWWKSGKDKSDQLALFLWIWSALLKLMPHETIIIHHRDSSSQLR